MVRKTSEKVDETVCPVCSAVYKDGDDWVACDLCDKWFDQQCSNLSDEQWSALESIDWYCASCLVRT